MSKKKKAEVFETFLDADAEIIEFLDGVEGVVEANSYEYGAIWETYHRKLGHTWVENLSGHGRTVGRIGDMPIAISLRTAVVKGFKILFVYPTSQVVDYRMIEAWLSANVPETTERVNGYLRVNDSNNFHNVFPNYTKLRLWVSNSPTV